MVDDTASLGLVVEAEEGADIQELEVLTSGLRRQLLQLDVEGVDRPRGSEAPEGTRGVDAAAVGSLIVTLASSGVLTSVVGLIQSWVASHHSRSVRLEMDGDTLEVTGLSSDDQRRLVTSWIERHSQPV